ncbi:MAG TPA: transposase [Blastocatellia bacterium]|nr:transposase [Blastocatellia bacterium]HMZ17956.1 transposase [Blastocatellia bacterium]
MLVRAYCREELRFAYCYRVYLRWRTYYAKPCAPLLRLDEVVLAAMAEDFGIRVLECACNRTDLLTLVSLKPDESISGCTGKLKARVSKWLREALQLQTSTDLLSRGYFACTTGKSNREAVAQYLDRQASITDMHSASCRRCSLRSTSSVRKTKRASIRNMPLSWRNCIWCWRQAGGEGFLAREKEARSRPPGAMP